MKNLGKISVLVLVATLILSLTLTSAPVIANGPTTIPSLEIDPQPTITATVSTEFTIQIWIRDIPEGFSLNFFDFVVNWDPTQMELVDHQEFTPPGKIWDKLATTSPDDYVLIADAGGVTEMTDIEMVWASLTFHCLAEGTSKITVSTASTNANTVVLFDGESYFDTQPDPFEITCNQVEPSPVGGVVVPTNTLAILTPYLALAGLVAVVSAVVVVKRRRA